MEKSASNSAKNSPAVWLIRSSTRVLGPFSLEEVKDLLASKHISIIDEIREPDGRWTYIRENEIFLELIRNLRDEQDDAVENTVTSTVGSHSFTKTIESTNLDEFTPTPILKDEFTRSQSGLRDITQATEVTVNPAFRRDNQVFGAVQDERMREIIRAKAFRWKLAITGLSVLVLILLGSFLFRQGHRKENDYDSLAAAALRYKSMGLYEKALTAYKRSGISRDPEPDLQYQMAPLMISEERQSLLGRRILERAALSPGRSRNELMEANIGIALTYIQEGDLREAETYLQKALTYEPSNQDAQTNLAIIQIKKGNYSEAAQALDALLKRGSGSSFLVALRAMVEIENSRKNPNPAALKDLYFMVQNQIKKSNFLRQELSFLWLNLGVLLDDKNMKKESLENFLDQAPFQSVRYKKNPFVDWRILQWDYIDKYCSEVFGQSTLEAQEKAARAICLMEVNRDQDAFRLISEARGENPKDPRLITLEAVYLMKTDRQREAATLLKMVPASGAMLPLHLNANLCQQQGNLDCADSYFRQMQSANSKDVESLYGLAWVQFEKNQRAKAYDFVRAGLQVEPNYLPILDLRNRLEEE